MDIHPFLASPDFCFPSLVISNSLPFLLTLPRFLRPPKHDCTQITHGERNREINGIKDLSYENMPDGYTKSEIKGTSRLLQFSSLDSIAQRHLEVSSSRQSKRNDQQE
jgi:hypothetical protein